MLAQMLPQTKPGLYEPPNGWTLCLPSIVAAGRELMTTFVRGEHGPARNGEFGRCASDHQKWPLLRVDPATRRMPLAMRRRCQPT